MPWKRERYPDDWEEMAQISKEWTDWKCEQCGVKQGTEMIGEKNQRPYKVVLALAHLNHDTSDNRPENLSPLCQACHLKHDRFQHGENARKTKIRNRIRAMLTSGQLEIFPEKETNHE